MAATKPAEAEYSAKDVAAHRSADDAWMVIHGEVYNVSQYINDHPGGAEVLLESAGTDASEAFDNAGHSEDASEIMAAYRVGKLKTNGRRPAPKNVRINSSKTATTTARKSNSEDDTPSWSSKNKSSSATTILTTGTALLSLGAVTVGALSYFNHSVSSSSSPGGLPRLDLSALWRNGFLFSPSSTKNGSMGFVHGILLSAGAFAAIDVLVLRRAMRLLQPDEHGFLRYPPHIKVPRAIQPDILLQSGWLDPAHSMTLPLVKKTAISHDVFRFTFELPTPDTIVGLPTGQHVAITATLPDTGEVVTRSYTPVSNNSDRGILELVVKIYPDGKLTGGYLANLQVGDEVSFRGPKGAMRYKTGDKNRRHLGMVAGGTGITPMFQLIRAICEDETDTTRISLVYGNRSVDDILLRDELDSYARRYPDNLSVWYVVNSAPGDGSWKYGTGFVTKDMLSEKLAPAVVVDEASDREDKSRVMLCGPPGMVNAAKAALVELGFEKPGASAKMTDQVFVF